MKIIDNFGVFEKEIVTMHSDLLGVLKKAKLSENIPQKKQFVAALGFSIAILETLVYRINKHYKKEK